MKERSFVLDDSQSSGSEIGKAKKQKVRIRKSLLASNTSKVQGSQIKTPSKENSIIASPPRQNGDKSNHYQKEYMSFTEDSGSELNFSAILPDSSNMGVNRT
jgi:hypothetical protein